MPAEVPVLNSLEPRFGTPKAQVRQRQHRPGGPESGCDVAIPDFPLRFGRQNHPELLSERMRPFGLAITEISEARAWLRRTESERSPMRTRREAFRVPVSTVIAASGFNPSRVISRKAAGSPSDTLLITAGTPH